MRTAGDVKPGDKVIYKQGYSVVEATVVEKPIDDKYERPKFLIGRVDLDNGYYLTRGSYIYDSKEECKEVIIASLQAEIENEKKMVSHHKSILNVLEIALKKLKEE